MEESRRVKTEKGTSTSFYDIVHQDFLPQGSTINKKYYFEVIRRLRESIRKNIQKCGKIVENSWILHHGNAPTHKSLLVSSFLAINSTFIMPELLYSPDLTPCDFFLFSKLKRPIKGRRFATIEEIKIASLEELKAIPKSSFQKCFDDWEKRWHKCIISKGDCFEGDNIFWINK